MVKTYIYLNILFIFGLVLYLFSINLDFDFYSTFYLFFSLFSILIPGIFLFSDIKYLDEEESRGYKTLFVGFIVYGVANLSWYLNESLNLKVPIEYINLLFIFQVFTKHYFLRFLTSQKVETKTRNLFLNLFSINLGILTLSIFLGSSLNLNGFIYDLYFILESFFTILFVFFYLNYGFISHIDLKYFILGNLIWFVADIGFLIESYFGVSFMGNLSDFGYYLGFYLMLFSILFKNFNLFTKLDLYFEKKLSFS